MKKLCALVASACGAFLAHAAEGDGIDLSGATAQLSSIASALKDWAGDALPILSGIAGAFLVFWLVRLVFRLVKGWLSAAK